MKNTLYRSAQVYLLDFLFLRSFEVSESTMSALRHSRLPEKDRCSPKYIL